MKVRPTKTQDLAALTHVLDGTGLFPSDMLPDMIKGFLSGESTEGIWLTCERDDEAIGFCYAAPEKLTEGTWNMLAIAVAPSVQGRGAGRSIVLALEDLLRSAGHRVLIADTSGTSEFDQTRRFYRKNGYHEEARIRDFWAAGNDKVVYWKAL
jgi:ribosomal protein S18 acetylase RimI-like enzyme